MAQVVISERYKGPPASGHGGYSCAMAAQFVDGPAEVTLRVPPPLEHPLEVHRDADAVRLLDGDLVVAEARPASVDVEVPAPVSPAAARAAAARSPLLEHHPFGTCFVCGTERAEGDGLRLFSGPVEGRDLCAAPWTAPGWMGDDEGSVRPEFLWSVLDCPSGNTACLLGETRPSVLGRFAADLVAPVRVGQELVAMGWVISLEGRKLTTGAAIHAAGGELCAVARALWIELTPEQLEVLLETSHRNRRSP